MAWPRTGGLLTPTNRLRRGCEADLGSCRCWLVQRRLAQSFSRAVGRTRGRRLLKRRRLPRRRQLRRCRYTALPARAQCHRRCSHELAVGARTPALGARVPPDVAASGGHALRGGVRPAVPGGACEAGCRQLSLRGGEELLEEALVGAVREELEELLEERREVFLLDLHAPVLEHCAANDGDVVHGVELLARPVRKREDGTAVGRPLHGEALLREQPHGNQVRRARDLPDPRKSAEGRLHVASRLHVHDASRGLHRGVLRPLPAAGEAAPRDVIRRSCVHEPRRPCDGS